MKIPGLDNWGLKLLALILAIVTYHALKDNSNNHADANHDRRLFQYR
jgi:hypothetical protein